ncbi:glycosyltransferase [Nocardioides conyzicola]|uniref:Glycosyltransferase family 4 protein n=1 Tax=Nocardioides conyzicola TaxID=1651781 RepID=A0ABP8WL37_9ACTN
MSRRLRALVVTVVHHPEDARIRHRQIAALLDAGWQVTYAAPFSGYPAASATDPALTTVDLPRARGRRRVRALRAARTLLRTEGPRHDVVLLHDPELLLATWRVDLPAVVWDVHEDAAASMAMKPWLPSVLAAPAAHAVRRLERHAERRFHLLLAEDRYQDRFRRPHPVVPNTTRVPASFVTPDDPRVVYVGHLSRARGVVELVETGALLHRRSDGRLRVQLVGHADAEATDLLAGVLPGVEWLGFRPYAEAMRLLSGATAGLSLLHDEQNYRVSRPTKVVEYVAHGVPVVTTPLPEATDLVERTGAGVVVPFVDGRADPVAVTDAVLALDANRATRLRMGASGHAYALEHLDWTRHATDFVDHLSRAAGAQLVP